jgi:hypothetical protein
VASRFEKGTYVNGLQRSAMRPKRTNAWDWKPRRRTFFEWFYDRDAPQDIFGKRPGS